MWGEEQRRHRDATPRGAKYYTGGGKCQDDIW
jgi:hypothetical protein